MEAFKNIQYQSINVSDLVNIFDLPECVSFQFFTSFTHPEFFDSFKFYQSLINKSFHDFRLSFNPSIFPSDIFILINFNNCSYVFFKVNL